MENIKIETTQNVDLEYDIAGIGDRMLAYLIDILILFVVSLGIMSMMSIIGRSSEDDILIIVVFLFYIPILMYDLLCEFFMNGQSFGKKAMKIKVVKVDGSKPTLSSYFLRWLLRLVDISMSFGVVGIITLLINGKGQRVGDIAAKTTIIKLSEKTSLKDTIWTYVEEDYMAEFQSADRLTEEDIATMKELLLALSDPKVPEEVVEGSWRAKSLLEERLEIKSDRHPVDFFRVLIKDYNGLLGRV